MLGIFGTIVGFYFGTELSAKIGPEQATVRVLPLRLSASSVVSGDKVVVTTYVSGGKAPYVYAIGFAETRPDPREQVEASGWIVREITAPPATAEAEVPIKVGVRDAEGRVAEAATKLFIKPSRPDGRR